MAFGLGNWLNGTPTRKMRGRLNSDEELGYNYSPEQDGRGRGWQSHGAKSCDADPDKKMAGSKPFTLRRLSLSGIHVVRSLLFLTIVSTIYLGARTSVQAVQLKQLRLQLAGKTLEFERQATRHFAKVQELTEKVAESDASRDSMMQKLDVAPQQRQEHLVQQQQLQQKLQEALSRLEAVQKDKQDLAAKLEIRSQEVRALDEKSKAVLDELSRLTSSLQQLKSVTGSR